MTIRIDDARSFTQLIRTLPRERLLRLAARAHQYELDEELGLIAVEFRRRRSPRRACGLSSIPYNARQAA